MTDHCPFCRIAARQLPAHIVHESERVVAFLDINPIRPGHTQVIPKEHFPYFDALPAPLLAEVAETGQKIARVLKDMYGVARVGFTFIGTDVPHVHGHVIPLVAADDLTSRRYIAEETVTYRAPPRPSDEEFRQVAGELRSRIGTFPA